MHHSVCENWCLRIRTSVCGRKSGAIKIVIETGHQVIWWVASIRYLNSYCLELRLDLHEGCLLEELKGADIDFLYLRENLNPTMQHLVQTP